MTDQHALYRSILANPEDDTPRLVYADWLEENGRAEEAEFIRVECRLASISPEDPDYVDLLDRREELRLWLIAHLAGPEVRLPAGLCIEGGADWWNETHRGFPRFLEYEGLSQAGAKAIRALAAALEKAFERIPTRWLSLRSITVRELAEFLRNRAVGGLDRLTIDLDLTEEPQDEACRLLADCPHLGNLKGLYLLFPIGDAGAIALAGSRHLPALRSLTLDQGSSLTPAGLTALGAAAWFRGLQELELSELTEPAFEELCRVAPLSALHTLELRETVFSIASWRRFARSRSFPSLTRLVNGTEMATGQIEALVEAEDLHLAVLELRSCAIGNSGARSLSRAPWLKSLRWLGLSFNLLSAPGFAAIAGCRGLTGLKYLDLSYNSPGARGLRALGSNPALGGLTTLLLNGTFEDSRGLSSARFVEFFTGLDMPNLRRLELTRRPLGARAARELSACKFASLRRLDLEQCQLTDAAMAALIASPALQNLVEFNAALNRLRTGVAALADRGVMPRLSAANFSGNRISRDLVRKLKRRPGVFS